MVIIININNFQNSHLFNNLQKKIGIFLNVLIKMTTNIKFVIDNNFLIDKNYFYDMVLVNQPFFFYPYAFYIISYMFSMLSNNNQFCIFFWLSLGLIMYYNIIVSK